jgi:hypothetical protein
MADKIDWLNVLDIPHAAQNARGDIFGDWYRDPWTWPELDWIQTASGLSLLNQRFNSVGVAHAAKLDVPKEQFIIRPAVVFDPVDRLVYQSLVDMLSVKFIGNLPPWVYGWRLSRRNPTPGRYNRRSGEWERYRRDLLLLASSFQCALVTDVSSFFSSIPLDPLCEQIDAKGGHNAITDRLIDMLQAWGRIAGRSGLPQRCNASSVLANMYLRPLDDALRHFGRQPEPIEWLGHDVAATRWMDDIWLFANDPGYLRRAQVKIQVVLQDLGLQISAAKTQVLEGDDVVRVASEIEHSAVEEGLAASPMNDKPLGELISHLLQKPEGASRTSVKFATKRMRDHKLFGHELSLVEAAARMPHVADALARTFSDSGRWRELDDWYLRFAKSEWGSIEWATAQLGTMFPSRDRVKPIEATFHAAVGELRSVGLFSLAAQRLATWDPGESRSLFRDAANRTADPQHRRILALAGLVAGEEPNWIRSVLSEFPENAVTLQMLEERGFRPPKVADDFDAEA